MVKYSVFNFAFDRLDLLIYFEITRFPVGYIYINANMTHFSSTHLDGAEASQCACVLRNLTAGIDVRRKTAIYRKKSAVVFDITVAYCEIFYNALFNLESSKRYALCVFICIQTLYNSRTAHYIFLV